MIPGPSEAKKVGYMGVAKKKTDFWAGNGLFWAEIHIFLVQHPIFCYDHDFFMLVQLQFGRQGARWGHKIAFFTQNPFFAT